MRKSINTLQRPIGIPGKSGLIAHQALIRRWREEGVSYRQIRDLIRETSGEFFAISTIHSFVKVRDPRYRKKIKKAQYALPSESCAIQTATATPSAAFQATHGEKMDPYDQLKQQAVINDQPKKKYNYDENNGVTLKSTKECYDRQ